MSAIAVFLERFILLPSSEIRDIGSNKSELTSENFCGFSKTTCGYCHFMNSFVWVLPRQNLFQQWLKLMKIGHQQISSAARGLIRLPSTDAFWNSR